MDQNVYQEVNRCFDSAAQCARNGCEQLTEPHTGESVRVAYDDEGNPFQPLSVISSSELMDRDYVQKPFLVEGLLTQGLAVLAGAPKVGKSWMVLHLCLQVAKGKPFLGLPTKKSRVLYIALEDDLDRLQKRLYTISESGDPNLSITTACSPLGEELAKEIIYHIVNHKPTRLIVIDTFQRIRAQGRDMSYANDYSEVSYLKRLADVTGACVLLVHHTRKLPDSDYMNEISGTNGIAGSADTLMVLKKEKRGSRKATLSCTGRDVEDRELELTLDRNTCIWHVLRDSLAESPAPEPPEPILHLIAYLKANRRFEGTLTELAAAVRDFSGSEASAISLSRYMNLFLSTLDHNGIRFVTNRTAGKRSVLVVYDRRCDRSSSPVTDG